MIKIIDYFTGLVFLSAAGFTFVFAARGAGILIYGIVRTASLRLLWTVGIVGALILVALLLAIIR